MPISTSEQLIQLVTRCEIVTPFQLDELFKELGTRNVEFEELQDLLLRRELVTNYQMERLLAGHTVGYYYGKYRVMYIVGAGTFARVYRAIHKDTGEMKAVKVLRSRYSSDDETMKRFLLEARTVMKLRHPNIVPITEVDTEAHRMYMVMDFVEGQNLRDYVSVHGKLEIMPALKICKDIISGLDYAFKLGTSHRDLKLSNILLASSGRALIVDFGLAAGDEKKDGMAGSPRSIDYAGLERASNVRRDDKRSDIFFWGCMMYQMIGGVAALEETRDRSQRLSASRYSDIKPIHQIDPEIPHRVAMLINRATAFHAEERFQTPGEALAALEKTIASIERGETKSFDAKLAEQELSQPNSDGREGESYSLMLVDSDSKIQDALREQLKNVGYRVLIMTNVERALSRMEDLDHNGKPTADCIIFGCGKLGDKALEGFNSFVTNKYTTEFPAVIMTSEKQADLQAEAKLSDRHAHVPLPLKMGVLRETLKTILKIAQHASS